MVIVEKANPSTDNRHQRVLERMRRLFFGPRSNRPRPEWPSQVLHPIDFYGIDRDMATDLSGFHSLQNRIDQPIILDADENNSQNPQISSVVERSRSPRTLTNLNNPKASTFHDRRSKEHLDHGVRIIPITIVSDSDKPDRAASVNSINKSKSPLRMSTVSKSDVIIIPSDEEKSGETSSALSMREEISHIDQGTTADSISDDVVIIPEPTDAKENCIKTNNVLRSNKHTLVGGANKVNPNASPDVYFTPENMDAGAAFLMNKAGASGSSSHAVQSKPLGEKPINDVPDYPIYTFLKKRLMKECRQIDHISGDGNCFFRALSKQLYGSECYHIILRNLIVDLVATNKNEFSQFVDGGDVQDHVERMSQEQSWATTCEIYAAATLLQRDIYMLTPDHLNETYCWLLFKPVFKSDPQQSNLEIHPCYITMCNTNGNHYDRIVAEHGGCNCFLPHPALDGITYSVDLTC